MERLKVLLWNPQDDSLYEELESGTKPQQLDLIAFPNGEIILQLESIDEQYLIEIEYYNLIGNSKARLYRQTGIKLPIVIGHIDF